ncbi:MAG TPA: leucyl aminopeptidase [Acidimicrobiales bacterium]|jgi:leucyl aminopeptidase
MIRFEPAASLPADVEAVGIPVLSDRFDDVSVDVDWSFLTLQGFEGKVGEVQVLPGDGAVRIAVGLGSSAEVTPKVVRRAAAALARAASRRESLATTLLEVVPGSDRGRAAQALAEGMALASYRFSRYKRDPKAPKLERVAVVVGGSGVEALGGVRDGLDRGTVISRAVMWARDLVNEPGGTLTPRVLAEAASAVADPDRGLTVEVLDEVDIEAAGLGGLLGVNRGSSEPPRFIRATYEPPGGEATATIALVGKGITFDAGGLSIKTAEGMFGMKDDMAGGAAVLGAMSALPELGVRVRVLAYVPATDNMLGGDATRPGDVLKIRNGTTVEVVNTDAEGRLILADALSMAAEERPDAIVDLATLTGAMQVALGDRYAGVMGNDERVVRAVLSAAERAGEPMWPMPLPEEYRSRLDSPVADLRNTGTGRYGGALVAGLFLKEFVDGVPWAHVDMPGPAMSEEESDERTKGATGFGVRTLIELLTTFEPLGG